MGSDGTDEFEGAGCADADAAIEAKEVRRRPASCMEAVVKVAVNLGLVEA
jgi:hypothetical protein